MEKENERETFNVIDENDNVLTATVISRLQVKDTDNEYLLYSVNDINDKRNIDESEKNEIILLSKIEKDENGEEKLVDIENKDEKDAVFESFANTYNKALKLKK